MSIEAVLKYAETNKSRFLDTLKELIAIPSVSGLEQYREDVRRCADTLVDKLKKSGLANAGVLNKESAGEVPLVFAEWNGAPGKPTVLIYGHYDVVGVDNKLLWDTEPFEATVKNGRIYGRGASDDKGQLLTSIIAAESLLKTDGKLPINIKFLFEGEEEGDSTALTKALSDDAIVKKLSCDAVFVSDGGWIKDGAPTITSGVRGVCEFEIKLKGPKSELHSGIYGGTVANPLNVLIEMIGKLWNDTLKVGLPGFYDDVAPMTEADRKEIADLPFDETEYCKNAAVNKLRGEAEYTPLERVMFRPTMDIVGIWGGHAGSGPKSAIPTDAGAKISMRLVANQDPKKIANLLKEYLKSICPDSVEMELEFFALGQPYHANLGNPMLQLGRRAMETVFGKKTVLARCGGSIPVVPILNKKLKAPVIMCNLSLPDDKAHGGNENIPLDHFYKGIEMYIRLFYDIAVRSK